MDSTQEIKLKLKKQVETLETMTQTIEILKNTILETTQALDGMNVSMVKAEYSLLNDLLKPGMEFKSLPMIHGYLNRNVTEFRSLNSYQLGILMSKAGYKSGTKNAQRGYYVTFREV